MGLKVGSKAGIRGGRTEKAYPLSYETKAAVGQTSEVIDLNGESAGIRTQDPRLKRAPWDQ